MLIFNHKLNDEFAFSKYFLRNKDTQRNDNEILKKESEEFEKAKFDKWEDIIIMIPLIFILLGIIIMSILYKIFM